MLRSKHKAIFSLKNAIFHVIQDLFWSDIYENDDLEEYQSNRCETLKILVHILMPTFLILGLGTV